jgi:hypothetical protein
MAEEPSQLHTKGGVRRYRGGAGTGGAGKGKPGRNGAEPVSSRSEPDVESE